MKEETKQDLLSAEELGEKYDEAAKTVWRNREILAPLLKYCVSELKDETVENIIQLIDADSISDEMPVSDLPPEVLDRGTEFPSVTEKPITFDFHLMVKNPKLSLDDILVRIHIDLEFQNKFRPTAKDNRTYPIEKRGEYYLARELSAQLGRITQKTNYNELEKVVSIWIISEDIPKDLQDTVSRYYFTKEDMVGEADIPKEDYDLMELVIVRRGTNGQMDIPVFDYLNAIFESDMKRIDQYTPASENPEIAKEVADMPGMGQVIYERGISQGISQGIDQGQSTAVINLFQKGKISVQDAAEELGKTIEELEQMIEQMSNTQSKEE